MPVDLETDIRELRSQIKALSTEEVSKRATAEAEIEKLRGREDRFSSENIQLIDNAFAEPDGLRDKISELRVHLDKMVQRHAGESNSKGLVVHDGGESGGNLRVDARSAARAFVQSDSYAKLRGSGALSAQGVHINTDPVEVLNRDQLQGMLRKRTTFDTTQGGAVIPIDQQVWPPVEIPVRQIRLIDLVTVGQTDSDQVKWAQQTLRSEVATETPYGDTAPESAYTYAPVTTPVMRIPAFIPATKDQLADQAQTMTLIESQLQYDVTQKLESEILVGAGGANAIGGIIGASNVGAYAKAGGDYYLDAIHKGITTVRLSLFADPTAVLIHPTDYESIVLQRDSYGRYLYPVGTETQTLWGLQPVISTVVSQGTAIVGDFRRGYTLWMRSGLAVYASDGYQDFFIRGMVAVLAELRAAGATTQGRAFCEVTGI